ncbi:hypothetical protein K438DRAFT_2028928 [Mycena galopus ATCC 62051]|nr:hypothetical protein K438DRAFT_2028928 [Mycena galopus ATCC 62051]
MASIVEVSPGLPLDLERVIFEIAAVSWPRLIPRLLLVAWRVKTWIEPLLYRTLIVANSSNSRLDADKFDEYTLPFVIEPGDFLSLIHSKPSTFFRDSVRNLRLGHNLAAEEALILSACSGIENLWSLMQTSVTILDFDLPLKRLHCTLHKMFEPSQIDFSHRFFACLTHLEIFDGTWAMINTDIWSNLTRLPCLTHLAFNDEDYLSIFRTLLPTWRSLQVLAILLTERMSLNEYELPELSRDWRVVVIECPAYLDDWSEGALTGLDYWSRAEIFIAKRKSREINPHGYYISDMNLDDGVENSEDSAEDSDDDTEDSDDGAEDSDHDAEDSDYDVEGSDDVEADLLVE